MQIYYLTSNHFSPFPLGGISLRQTCVSCGVCQLVYILAVFEIKGAPCRNLCTRCVHAFCNI